MISIALLFLALLSRDEAELREAYSKGIQEKETSKRVEAVKKLAGSKEEKTLALLAAGLKDPAKEVRKAVAETLEGCDDGGGAAIKPLGELLADKKVDPDLRLACAKALCHAR